MNTRHLLLASALAGGLFVSVSASASTPVAPVAYAAPAPATVVSPENLPRSLKGAVVTLSMTIDAQGNARDIKVVSRGDKGSTPNLVAAISQWKFTPARKNGVPVSSKVLLPVELVES